MKKGLCSESLLLILYFCSTRACTSESIEYKVCNRQVRVRPVHHLLTFSRLVPVRGAL